MSLKDKSFKKKEQTVKKTFSLGIVQNNILEKMAEVEGVSQSEMLNRCLLTPKNELIAKMATDGVSEIFAYAMEIYAQKCSGPMNYDKSRFLLMFLKDYIMEDLDLIQTRMKEHNQYFWVKSYDLRDIPEAQTLRDTMEQKTFVKKEQLNELLDICISHLADRNVYANDCLFSIFIVILRSCSVMYHEAMSEQMAEELKRLARYIFVY